MLSSHRWLTVVHLPRDAPGPDTVEALWSQVKTRIADRALHDLAELEVALTTVLRWFQKSKNPYPTPTSTRL